ncbi:aromatic acid exporter family protein, partial [Enterococcus faecium]
RDISDTYFNKMCQRIKAMNYSGYGLLIYTAETFSESNDGRQILTRIEEVYVLYRQMPLPTSRPEFEDRAELFQFLQSFKSFIEIKAEFSQQKIQK